MCRTWSEHKLLVFSRKGSYIFSVDATQKRVLWRSRSLIKPPCRIPRSKETVFTTTNFQTFISISHLLALFSTTDAILVAKYNMGSVTGTIRFSPNSQNDAVDIVLNLTGLPGGFYYQLELHEYRVNYDTAERCSVASIGNR